MQAVSQFQGITNVEDRDAVEFAMKWNQWNLKRAINWFHKHRHNDDDPDLKRALRTKEEIQQEEAGTMIRGFKEILTQSLNYLK